jgi:pimeloyl-ACP methyl ester carboxylesterase
MGIPASVKDMIGQRLARHSDGCRRMLAAAAVVGREFDLSVLERMTDVPDDGLLEALDEALAAGIIIEAPPEEGRYAFVHALFRDTLYEEMTATKRMRLHGQTLRYVQASTARLAYEVLGHEGPHLVATGLSNCPSVRARISVEKRLWERISRHCRVVLYDRRGIGSSEAPEHGYSLRGSVEDLRAVFDAAGIERGVLWGASDGGPLAIAFAVQYPGRVAGMILFGTTARLVNTDDFAFGINPAALDSFRRVDQFDPGRAVSQITHARRRRLEEANPIGDVMRRVPRSAWSKIIGSLGVADVRDVLSQVHTPTLIIHDPQNTYIPVDAARYLHERIPASTLDITEDAALPLLSDALYGKIEGFIDDVAAKAMP